LIIDDSLTEISVDGERVRLPSMHVLGASDDNNKRAHLRPEIKAVELGEKVRLTLVKSTFSVTKSWLDTTRFTELTLRLPFTCTFVSGCNVVTTKRGVRN